MLLSMGLGALNAQLLSAGYSETKKRQALIKDALTAYLGANKRLPCPAVANPSDTPPVSGLERRAGTGLSTEACAQTIGVLPYATLGLGRELALDGWGNFMSYSVAKDDPATCPPGGTGIDWSLTACFGAGKTGRFSVNAGTITNPELVAFLDNTTTPATDSRAIAMVVSHGPNGFGAWGQQGSQYAAPTSSCEESHNAPTTTAPAGCTRVPNVFYKGERPGNDDVVVYLMRNEAINALAIQGTLKTADGQVAEDLTSLRNEKLYAKVLSCSASVAIAKLDPWGNPYQARAGATNDLPLCLCSTKGTGVIPTQSECANTPEMTLTAPTSCVRIQAADVNVLKPTGATAC